jgi:amino acid adenylation domain-containing protein
MANTREFSEAKRALLEKYLRGNSSQNTMDTDTIPRRAPGSSAPLSFGQQQLWLISQLIPDTPVYNECVTLHLSGPLDVVILEQSLNEFIRRHEAWRTSFPLVDGPPVQMIHPTFSLSLPVADLRHLPEFEREAEALRLATENARMLFDLAHGPLLRVILIRLSDEEHRLFLTLHHIIFDGFAINQVFLPELHTLYKAFSTGQHSTLPDLPIQYADFATWQRESLRGEKLANQLTYWKKQLADAPVTLELPTDRPRPLVSTYQGSVHRFALSKHLADALKALSRQEGVTLYMTMVAAFKTLLYRYTDQCDLLIGTVTSGRKRPEVQKLMGFFLNTLVLRTDLSGNPSFRELLVRVREVVLEAIAHEDVPFEYLVKELQPERNLSQNPLFQVLLTLEIPLLNLPLGWTLTQMDATVGTSRFDLYLLLEDRSDGLIGHLEYNTDLFDVATINRMVGHWQRLLEGVVANPNRGIADVPLLTDAEWQQQVVEWNATQIAYPQNQCFHELFEAQVERTPEAVAVVFEQEQLTYRELNQRSNQLAHYLRDLGVGPETLVSLLAEREIAFLIAILAVFKAGGAYLPLDPHHPPMHLRRVLEHSGSRFVLTTRGFASTLSQALVDIPIDAYPQVVYLEDFQFRHGYAEGILPVHSTPRNLAYVIYTSGSTGMSKGVMIEQRGMLNHIYAKIAALDLTETDRVAQTASQCFDISVWQFLAALLVGGCVHIFPDGVAHDPMQLLEQVDQYGISILETVPSLLRTMLEGYEVTRVNKPSLKKLRWLIPTGEALSADLCCRWLSLYPQIPLLNAYGPTECSDDVTHHSIYQPPMETESYVPIGRALANTQLYVLDRELMPVPIGVNGELYVGGIGVGRGYLGDAQRTAEAFVPDPFSREPGARLYKTGDLARYLPDGTLQFLGRIDHQVKVRGNRIELGEIEMVLRQHPVVRDAVVVAREDAPGDQRLVAYVALHKDQSVTVGDLQSHVMQQLPIYMLPSAFVLLEALPLTPNGKVDRRALPTPEWTRSEREEAFIAPTLLVHQQLGQIWEELLDVRPISIRDNFFELGGHSLLAVRLVDRIEQIWGKKISPSALLAGPTIEQLANILEQSEDTGLEASPAAVQANGSRRSFSSLRRLLTPLVKASRRI